MEAEIEKCILNALLFYPSSQDYLAGCQYLLGEIMSFITPWFHFSKDLDTTALHTPQKVTHLSPITFQATESNEQNFLRNWSHGVRCHVWLWRNVAHISISPSTRSTTSSPVPARTACPTQGGWVQKLKRGASPIWSKAAWKGASEESCVGTRKRELEKAGCSLLQNIYQTNDCNLRR